MPAAHNTASTWPKVTVMVASGHGSLTLLKTDLQALWRAIRRCADFHAGANKDDYDDLVFSIAIDHHCFYVYYSDYCLLLLLLWPLQLIVLIPLLFSCLLLLLLRKILLLLLLLLALLLLLNAIVESCSCAGVQD